MTKAALQKRLKELEETLEVEQARPTGSTISNCHIDMTKPDETKIAVANAVSEGMKALQSLGGDSTGIYIAGT